MNRSLLNAAVILYTIPLEFKLVKKFLASGKRSLDRKSKETRPLIYSIKKGLCGSGRSQGLTHSILNLFSSLLILF
jgi:hypothetical protein